MTTVNMSGFWVQWNAARTRIDAWGQSTIGVITPGGTLSYTYDAGWTEGSGTPPPVTFFPAPQVIFADGSVRFINNTVSNAAGVPLAGISDGTSNTVFFGETGVGAGFAGDVLAIRGAPNGRDYYVALDGSFPISAGTTLGTIRQILPSLEGSARQITSGVNAPGEPVLLDGTSNTISVTENDLLQGDVNAQDWRGGIGRDTMEGRAGDDILWGDGGGDRLSGDDGNDTLMGGDARDVLNGGRDNDLLHGGLGNDVLNGSQGNDRLFGGDPQLADSGNDDLFGGAGNDSLYGGRGDDVLDGGAGNDLLVLGQGADGFVFANGSGDDRVADFSLADGDVMRLNANLLAGQTTGQQVLDAFAAPLTGNQLVIHFGGGDRLTLTVLGDGSNPVTLSAIAAQIEII